MIIRTVIPEDAAQIAGIINEYVVIGGVTAIQREISVSNQRDIIHNLPLNTSFLVAEDEDTNKIIGFQVVEPHMDLPANTGSIITFSKIGESQKGVGSALFARTRKAVAKLAYHELDATIRMDNLGGQKFYDRMGFQDHSIANKVHLKDGTTVDQISKRLHL